MGLEHIYEIKFHKYINIVQSILKLIIEKLIKIQIKVRTDL